MVSFHGPASLVPEPPVETPAEISLFLGAGMSTVYGMPTTAQFRDRMLRRYPHRPAWGRLLEDPALPGMEDVWAAVERFNDFEASPGR